MDGGRDGEWRFGQVLSRLKDRGCTVMVTGDVSEEAFDKLSTDFLGGYGAKRSRVFALLDRDLDVARARNRRAGPGYEPALVVDAASKLPRAQAASRPHLDDRTLAVRYADDTPSALETQLVDAVHDARQLHGPFEPGELRVCVDSLRPLADQYDLTEVYDSLVAVGEAVVESDGMAHFLFPGDRDDPAVRSLVPAFDVLVELRDENDLVEQRWTFRDYDVPSLWMSI